MSEIHPVIIGAGPAGIRAAETLVAAGLRPIVVDEAFRFGGQIYRQPPDILQRPGKDLYGFEAAKAASVHQTMQDLLPKIDYRPNTLVWGTEGGSLNLLNAGQPDRLPYSHLILATGATDRVLPFPGWTLPGVYTLGGAQVSLKFQASVIGPRVAFIGTGPLLYLVAYQYLKAGADVAAVLDTAPFTGKIKALPKLLDHFGTFAKGLYYMGLLAARGVKIRFGVRPLQAAGTTRVEALYWRNARGRQQKVTCDAIAWGLALRSETQLADLLGCQFTFDDLNRNWLPTSDAFGRSSVTGIYLAGDGAGIKGADAAELAGQRAALALLADLQYPVDQTQVLGLKDRLDDFTRFREGLEQAFPFPDDWAKDLPDDLILCRCEEITLGALRQAVHQDGVREINRLKALTRIGMGRCQGRICGTAAAECLAHESHQSLAAVGRLRAQPPIKPIPFMGGQ